MTILHLFVCLFIIEKKLVFLSLCMQLDGGTVSLSMAEIKAAYPDIKALVGHSVYVKASVLTKTGKNLSVFNQTC